MADRDTFGFALEKTLELVRDVFLSLSKTVKAFNTYPKDNPIYQKFAGELLDKFKSYFEYENELAVDVRQNSLLFKEREVYTGGEKGDSIALQLFADGIRQITFQRGLTYEEIFDFMDVLRAAPTGNLQDDIVTLLWEKNIKNIDYTVVRDEGDDLWDIEQSVVPSEETESTLMGATYSDITIKPVSLGFSVEPMSPAELDAISKELMGLTPEYLSNSSEEILFEILENESDMTYLGVQLKAIGELLDAKIDKKDLAGAMKSLERLRLFETNASGNEINTTALKAIDNAGRLDNLRKIFLYSTDVKQTSRFLGILNEAIIPDLITLLGELQDKNHRKLVLDVLIKVGRRHVNVIAGSLLDGRWYLVRNLVIVLGMLHDPQAVKFIEKVMGHPDIRVRREAVKALEGIPVEESKKLLLKFLKDKDQHIRIAAIRALRKVGDKQLFMVLADGLTRDEMMKKPYTEKKEFLETVASLGGADAFPLMSKLFKRKGIIEKSESLELRACAAYGLGVIGTTDAVALLEKSAGSGKGILRDACQKAIKEAGLHGNKA